MFISSSLASVISSSTRKFTQELLTPLIHVQIDEASIYLAAIMGFLKEVDSRWKDGDRIPPCVSELRDLAYFIEDAIDVFRATVALNRKKSLDSRFLSLLVQSRVRVKLAHQIKDISKKTREIFQPAILGDEIRFFQGQPIYRDGCSEAFVGFERLPSFLKPCFLYLVSFPEEDEIPVRSVIKIWIAEGFIPQERRGIPEDIAESYIEHLILRSMVRVTKKFAGGAIKSIRMDTFFRGMAIHVARGTSFLTINPTQDTNADTSKPRRAAFHGEVDNRAMDGFPHLRALLALQVRNLTSMKFEFLRVMELGGSANLHYLPKQFKYMVLLRYLGLRNTGIVKLPNSIGNLLNLQTLDVRNTEITHIPKSLWNINSLRHVQVPPHRVEGPPLSAHLENLQTVGVITTPKAWEKGSPCLPNLRKFQIDHPENLNWSIIVGLVRKLDQLVSLKISSSRNIPNEIVGTATDKCHSRIQHLHLIGVWSLNLSQQPIQLPPNLTKLVLDSSRIVEDPMPTLGKLRSLRVLRLLRDAITAKEIVCSTGGFPKLEHLEINNLANLEKWTVGEHAMPMLNYLCVKQCPQIETLPELQHVTTLSWDANLFGA